MKLTCTRQFQDYRSRFARHYEVSENNNNGSNNSRGRSKAAVINVDIVTQRFMRIRYKGNVFNFRLKQQSYKNRIRSLSHLVDKYERKRVLVI